MQCPGCQAENRDGRRFCGKCGTRLPLPCGACGFVNEPADVFCGGCGIRLTAPDRPAAPADGERRDVTVLCTDLQGYTPLSEKLGEEGAYRVMDDVYKAMIAVVHDAGGTVQELTGDGILALFGAPVALEDAPLRACRAALDIQARMIEVSARLEQSHGVAARVRVGLNSGPVVVATVGGDVRVELKAIGDTVNMAARMQTMAEPGTVLLSEATWRLVADAADAIDLGERPVKGKSQPQRVFQLVTVRDELDRFERARRRGLAPFVARRQELDTLERFWRESQDGAGRIVHVAGEAGIGKTRLVHELRSHLGPHVLSLWGHCTETAATTAFAPFIEIVREVFQLRAGDDGDTTARKIANGFVELGIDDQRLLPYLLSLLGFEREELRGQDGEIVGVHTRDALARVLRERCRRAPCLVLVDDVHWLDRSSEQLLAEFLAAGLPPGVTIVCTQRPEYRPIWRDHPRYGEVALGGLSTENLADLVRQCAGAVSDDAVAAVLRAAGGNPLFAEEMSRWMAEHAGPRAVPSSLQGLMMARVDRLAATQREVLQVAAVAGQRFRADLVVRVAGLNGEAPAILRELEGMDLVRRDDGDGVYAFRHGVMQETIYQSLLTPRRRELHRRLGEAIEKLYADRLGEWVDLLAHHFTNTDDTGKAAVYLAEAGRRSLRIYALAEADDRFRAACDLIDRTPSAVNDAVLAQIVRDWAHVYYYRRDFKGLVELVTPYLPRIEALGASRQRAMILFWLGFAHWMQMQGDDARHYASRALELAEALGDDECIGYASMGVIYSISDTASPDVRRRLEALGPRALDIATRRHDVYLASKLRWGYALVHLFAGRIALALRATTNILELGRAAGDPRTIAFGLWGSAIVLNVDERHQEALAAAEEALRISPDPLDRLAALGAKGTALAVLNRADDAIVVLQTALAEVGQYGMRAILPSMEPSYGAALALGGRLGEAAEWLEEIARRYADSGCAAGVIIARLALGEIYSEVARRTRPLPKGALMRNLPWLVKRAAFAHRHARAHLESAARLCRAAGFEGSLAWALADLAILDVRRAPDKARAFVEEAEQLARDLGTTGIARRIAEARALIRDTARG